jgi:hypothetical protein
MKGANIPFQERYTYSRVIADFQPFYWSEKSIDLSCTDSILKFSMYTASRSLLLMVEYPLFDI